MGRPRRCGAVLLCALVLALVTAAPAAGDEIELTPTTRQSLLQLQERWNQWLAAFYQGNADGVRRIADQLVASTRSLGMQALPDLARAAVVQAMEVARDGDFERARLALASAERLDPGRPETAFARSRVERLDGRWALAARSWVDGWVRLARLPLERRLWLDDALLWLLCSLLLAAALFVLAELALHGAPLLEELRGRLARHVPPWGAAVAALLVLFWPLALPGGLVWGLLYVSVWLWGRVGRSERVVLALLWLLAGAVPLAVAAQRDRTAVELSPPVRAVEELARGRLYGGLFSDLGVLPGVLPDDPAVEQLLADLHRRLGQWEIARSMYQRVLEAEPANASALLDLGAYYFYRGDLGSAARYLEEATEADPTFGLAWFDLSQVYSQSYLFDEMRRAIDRARALGGSAVSRWVAATGDGRVLNADGGLARRDQIRRRLLASWRPADDDRSRLDVVRRARALLLPVLLIAAAISLGALLRRGPGSGGDEPVPAPPNLWWRAATPGWPSLAAGHGLRALLALWLPAACLLLPSWQRIGFEIPVGFDTGNLALPLAVAGLVVLAVTRFTRALRAA